ncbi:MAG: hypothetical protein H6R18_1941 [Proteobacteria bacterium]|nr:hypothetical protein [Pseudomonadota bacterium]
METTSQSGNFGSFEANVGLAFHKTIDYDRRAMRKALVQSAAMVRKEARRMISSRAVSGAGEMPGMQTGAMRRAIGIISRGSKGGWIKVGVKKSKEMTAFYPAFLFYGSRKRNLAKRGNYIIAALDARRDSVRAHMRSALQNSLVPR